MPPLSKKAVQIMALRHMLMLRLTAKDISTALPLLRELRDAEKAQQARTEQILEEEKKALLAADSEDPPVPDSGLKLQEAGERFRFLHDRAWTTLAQSIGPQKAGGLRQLVEPVMAGPVGPGGMPGGDGFNGAPGGPPVGPGAGPEGPPRFPPGAGPEPPQPPGAPQAGTGGGAGFAPNPPSQGQPGIRPRRGAQRPGAPGTPGFQPGPMGPGPMMPMRAPGYGPPTLALSDLVDLLEQKLAAMKK